jgi:hypothetical protein
VDSAVRSIRWDTRLSTTSGSTPPRVRLMLVHTQTRRRSRASASPEARRTRPSHAAPAPPQPPRAPADNLGRPASHPTPGPAEVYAALWLGSLLIAGGAAIDPLPAELAGRYFKAYPPHAKA